MKGAFCFLPLPTSAGRNTTGDRVRIEARFQAVPNQYEASEWADISGEVRVAYSGG